MISKYYINGKEVDSNIFYHPEHYFSSKEINGIQEHHWENGKIDTYVYVNGRFYGSVEDVKKNKLLFLIQVGMSIDEWCRKHHYRKHKGGKK